MDTQILAALKSHWKRFLWMWIFPILFLCSFLLPGFSKHPFVFFFAIDLPVFFVCYYLASKPVRQRKVTAGQGMVLIVLLPFVLWASLIFGLFGIFYLLNAGHDAR